MSKLMKPERLSFDSNSSSAANEWQHWKGHSQIVFNHFHI